MALPTKQSDSQLEAAKVSTTKPEEHSNNLLSIVDSVKKNAVAPAINSLAIEPANVALNVVNGGLDLGTWVAKKAGYEGEAPQLPKVSEMETGKPESTAAAYSQQIFSTAGSFLSYAIAGKLAGRVMRAGGELMPLEAEIRTLKIGRLTRTIAQDARVATVVGATVYAGLKDTKEGESHWSNAASTFIGFSAFEVGNSAFVNPRASTLAKMGQRFAVGYVGGIAQSNTASLIQENKLADNNISSGLSGGALNALMPAGHRAIDEVAARNPLMKVSPYANEAAAKLHLDAVKSLPNGKAPEPGSWADPKALEAVNRAILSDLHTKVKVGADGETRIDQKKNLVHLQPGADPLTFLQEIAHRQIFKDPKYEKAFKSQAAELHSTNAADPANATVKEKYVQTRIEQEVAARTAQNEAAANLNAPVRVSVDADVIRNKEGYGARFEAEATEFIKSGGKTRPVVDHSGPDGHGGADHAINTTSHDHAQNDHGGSTPQDGPGGGATTDATAKHGDSSSAPNEHASASHDHDLRDWPEADESGASFEPASPFHPSGREYYWYNWTHGTSVNGHDNVVWAAHYDAGMNEVILVKRDPVSNELSTLRTNNDGKTISVSDGVGGVFHATNIETHFPVTAKNIDGRLDILFDAKESGTPRSIKYDVAEGTKLVPPGTTYTKYFDHVTHDIEGSTINPAAKVEYHDGTGRIDWQQMKPFPSVISEYPTPREWTTQDQPDVIRYKVSQPQNLPGSHRFYRLDDNNNYTGITDVFSKDHPLNTDFGNAVRVDRGAPDGETTFVYTMEDGSSTVVCQHKATYWHDGVEYKRNPVKDPVTGKVIEPPFILKTHHDAKDNLIEKDTRVYGAGAGYTESFSQPWETVFGQANKVKIMPDKANYELVNGGNVDHYEHPIDYENIKNVKWVYYDKSGDRTVQLDDPSATKIILPKNGVHTGIADLSAFGYIHTGNNGFTRYYLDPTTILGDKVITKGQIMDVGVVAERPASGIIKENGKIIEVGDDANGQTTMITMTLDDSHLPQVAIESLDKGVRYSVIKKQNCVDDAGVPLPIFTETYPGTLTTPWGRATVRKTFWNGKSLMRIAVDPANNHFEDIKLDKNGDRIP